MKHAASLDVKELLRPEAFPHPVERLELRETHISWVVLTGPFAYKIKKPVKLGFIDASTLERRLHYCNEELRLNHRLASDLYVDVAPIVRVGGLAAIGVGGLAAIGVGGRAAIDDEPAIEYAVRMRQFDAADELPALLANNAVEEAEIAALGEALAHFHLEAPVAPWNGVGERTQYMYQAVLGNLDHLIAHASPSDGTTLGRLVDWTHDNAAALEPSFRLRERSGFVRECHGDLHAANIVRLGDRLTPFDCIEFDPALRWIDVLSDVAFLVMDFTSHRRPDLACALLSRYLEVTGDYEGVGLLRFYAVYRALVRAKVDAIAAEQVPSCAPERRERLQRRLEAAAAWMSPLQPRLILMHGASGSGKSWLSERLVPALNAVRIRSDLERKRLAGIAPAQAATAPVRQGLYSPQFSHRTYARLADSAEICLQAGVSVIVDAAFLDPADRELFCSLAARLRAPFAIVSCQADPAMLAARVLQRTAARKDPSDADLTVLDAQLREIAPFSAAEQPRVVTIDANTPDPVRLATAGVDALCPIEGALWRSTRARVHRDDAPADHSISKHATSTASPAIVFERPH